MCDPYSASVTLELTTKRPEDIDCLGDTISYSCSILSNSETLDLIWRVTIPGLLPINIMYNINSSLGNVEYFPENISVVLTSYRKDMYIISSINFKVLRYVTLNETLLECGMTGFNHKSVHLLVNSLGKI